jgi:hypothetical protein
MKKYTFSFVLLAGLLFALQMNAQVSTGKPTNKTTSTTAKPGTVSSTSKGAAPAKMYDAAGTLLYSFDQLGYVRNSKNRVFFQYSGGDIIKKRVVVGSVKNGVFRDRTGKEYARIVQDGKVVDPNSKTVGTVKNDGTILDKNGVKIGSAPGVDVNVAVMVYFYKDVLENAKSKSSVK